MLVLAKSGRGLNNTCFNLEWLCFKEYSLYLEVIVVQKILVLPMSDYDPNNICFSQ